MSERHSVLIAAADRSYARGMADAMHQSSGLSVVSVTDSVVQAVELARRFQPELAVLESSLACADANPIALLRMECPVLLVVENSSDPLPISMLRGAAAVVFKSSGEQVTVRRAVRVIEEQAMRKEKNVSHHVTEILQEMGIPPHIKGYRYLREAILLAVEDSTVLESITKVLYPGVACRFETTSARVERDIRRAICVAWERGDDVSRRRYFRNTVSHLKGKPTNSEFIAMIADHLCLQYGSKTV